ncbi:MULTISPECIES: Rib/alpha-like domain-containing protein, partial [unclassified Streptococcus]|uniref:Rib/alpha-like domain-containing protein n=1 Tax=unclassified Streptococcus TaxID=2608887 RepID=UPI0018833EA3
MVYDTTDNKATPGTTVESTTSGLMPNREYQIQWFKDGNPIGSPVAVTADNEGRAKSVPITVEADLSAPAVYTSGVFLQGVATTDITSALALDSFVADVAKQNDLYQPSYEEKNVVPGTPATSTPSFTDKDGNVATPPAGSKFAIAPDFTVPDGYTISIDENTGVVTVSAPDSPAGATVETVTVPVVVTYPDTTTDKVDAVFHLDTDGDNTPDKDDDDDDNDGIPDTEEGTDGTNPKDPNSARSSITPIDDQTVEQGTPIKNVTVEGQKVPTGGSFKVEGLPDGVTFDANTNTITGTPTTVGESTVKVTVLDKNGVPVKDANGNSVTEEFKITVTEKTKQADSNEPTPADQTVKVGETPSAEKSISNLPSLPEGTKVSFESPVDTETAGDKPAVVVVTYPDGSTDKVPVTVKVEEAPKQADSNEPTPADQTVKVGETPSAEKSISNLPSLPEGTTVSFESPVDTETAGDKPAVVVVTYPDGSQDKVPVTVKVEEAPKQADSNEPTPADQTVKVGDTPSAEKSISNLPSLPEGTKVSFESPVDTETAGDKPAVVVVTYPDGSQDKVPVTVKVEEAPKQADSNEPTPADQTVKVGETPSAEKSISNLPSLPESTTVSFESPVDTKTAGDKPAVVVVTYPDGSTDKVPVTVKVEEAPTQADSNEPTPADQTVKVGDTPSAEKSISNLPSLPEGTKVSFESPVDTETAGDKPAVVVVTYPDG